MSLPNWKKTDEGYECNDDRLMTAAYYCEFAGFDLPAFDVWLSGLDDCGAKTELLQRRELMLNTLRPADGQRKVPANQHEFARHAEWMIRRKKEIQHEDYLLPGARMGAKYSAEQSDKGVAGAQVRWGNRKEINDFIKDLAARTDNLGDPLPNDDLWPEFFNKLHEKELNPQDTSGETIKNSDRMAWDGNKQGMTFKTFKNNIASARKK